MLQSSYELTIAIIFIQNKYCFGFIVGFEKAKCYLFCELRFCLIIVKELKTIVISLHETSIYFLFICIAKN